MRPTPFPQIGNVIAQIGSQGFPCALRELINTQLASAATQVCWLSDGKDVAEGSSLCLRAPDEPGAGGAEITVLRATPQCGFTLAERRRLRVLSPLLFSILDQHVTASRAACTAAEASTPENLARRFQERLCQAGLRLSERETQVCLGLLTGLTAQQQAERLTLTVHTVGSYQRRAAQKLGISGRRALTRWLYEALRDS